MIPDQSGMHSGQLAKLRSRITLCNEKTPEMQSAAGRQEHERQQHSSGHSEAWVCGSIITNDARFIEHKKNKYDISH